MIILFMILWIVLGLITIQDYRERSVYWFLYPIVGILVFSIQIIKNNIYSVLINSICNLIFVIILLSFTHFYSKIRFKKALLNESLGLGDVLFFLFITFSFAPISFIILFVFSLLFSLVTHLYLASKNSGTTVPLAGYMSLFFGIVYGIVFFTKDNFLYAY